jgi:hypothetical protein
LLAGAAGAAAGAAAADFFACFLACFFAVVLVAVVSFAGAGVEGAAGTWAKVIATAANIRVMVFMAFIFPLISWRHVSQFRLC